jgi:LppP/LprE lipoprotein
LTPGAARATIAPTMDASARRVHAARARRRLPPRLRRRSWGTRIAGVLGTAGLAGVAIAIAVLVMPNHHAGAAALATPPPHHKQAPKPKRHKPAGPTKAQLAQRRAAVAIVRAQGYTPVSLGDYSFKTRLHVLIGKRTPDGAKLAFFFILTHYLGHDSESPSARLSLVANVWKSATLAYRTYAATDSACCPSGPRVTVRFTWNGTQLVPRGTIPPSSARLRTG